MTDAEDVVPLVVKLTVPLCREAVSAGHDAERVVNIMLTGKLCLPNHGISYNAADRRGGCGTIGCQVDCTTQGGRKFWT